MLSQKAFYFGGILLSQLKSKFLVEAGFLEDVKGLKVFIRKIQNSIEGVELNGSRVQRLCNNINLRFRSVNGRSLARKLNEKNIYVSAGSACLSGGVSPSHVLLAMGVPEKLARASVRFSLGRYTTDDEVVYVLRELPAIIRRMRASSVC